MKRILLAAVLVLSATTPVLAADGRLRSTRSDQVIVWRNKDAHNEALDLIRAGVHHSNPAMLTKYVACMVPNGTTAVRTSGGWVTVDVLVTDGTAAGCRGNIPVEDFAGRR